MPLPKFDPLLQFRAPYNYELAGKHYQFVMDDGNEYYVNFLDEENLQWVENKNPYCRNWQIEIGTFHNYLITNIIKNHHYFT